MRRLFRRTVALCCGVFGSGLHGSFDRKMNNADYVTVMFGSLNLLISSFATVSSVQD